MNCLSRTGSEMGLLWDTFTQKERVIASKPEEACMCQTEIATHGGVFSKGSCHLKAISELEY